jgi:hypothetical protein
MQKTLLDAGVKLLPYEDVLGFIKETEQKGKIWFDGKSANLGKVSYLSSFYIYRLQRITSYVLLLPSLSYYPLHEYLTIYLTILLTS